MLNYVKTFIFMILSSTSHIQSIILHWTRHFLLKCKCLYKAR